MEIFSLPIGIRLPVNFIRKPHKFHILLLLLLLFYLLSIELCPIIKRSYHELCQVIVVQSCQVFILIIIYIYIKL